MKPFIGFFLMIVVCGLLFLFFTSITNKKEVKVAPTEFSPVIIPDSIFKSGDLIFREGNGFLSEVFRKLSLSDPRYSHAGIIHREGERIFVYHLIGAEQNNNNVIRKDLLVDFYGKAQAKAFAVYRCDLDGNKIDEVASRYYMDKISFDLDFDLATDQEMYCTEFLFKTITKVAGDENYLPLTNYRGIQYEACDNIYLSPHSQKIFSLNYNTHEK